jgi:hypothetical protein
MECVGKWALQFFERTIIQGGKKRTRRWPPITLQNIDEVFERGQWTLDHMYKVSGGWVGILVFIYPWGKGKYTNIKNICHENVCRLQNISTPSEGI